MPLHQSFAKRVCAVIALAIVAPPVWSADAATIFRQAAPSVVLVYALDSAGEEIAQGSGVIVGKNYVATNCHVLKSAWDIKVKQTESDKTFALRSLRAGTDKERDLCLLFVQDLSKSPAAQPARIAGARGLEIGATVFAIGAPNGLELSLTRGIVSQLRDIDGESVPQIQTDAAVTFGSSGGGLFDENGRLVGITTLGSISGNFNFAIPAEWVAEMLEERSVAFSSPGAQTESQTLSGSLEWDILYEEVEKLREQGDYRRGISVIQKALEVAETSFGKDDKNTGASVNLLGLLYALQGDYAAAETLYKRALAIAEKTFGAQHPNTAASLNNLADLYRAQGDYATAEPLHKRALAIHEKTLGAQHPGTATSLNNLAAFYESQGDYATAEPLYKRALSIHEKILGAQHPRTAASLNNLAALYNSQGDYAAAEPLYKRALAIREKTLGAQHPNTAGSLNNLAFLYYSQGDYAAAEPLYKRALAIHEKTLGAQHPSTATSLNNLADLYASQGDYAVSETLHKRALAIREKTLGAQHPDTAGSLNNLAELYYSQGDYATAKSLLKDALVIFRETVGESHPSTVITLKNLSGLYEAMGESAKALEYFNLAKQARARQ